MCWKQRYNNYNNNKQTWKINRSWILLCADQDFTHCAHNRTISSCPVAAYPRYIAQVKSRSGKPASLSGHAAFLRLGLNPFLLSSLSQTSGSCSPSKMIPLRRPNLHIDSQASPWVQSNANCRGYMVRWLSHNNIHLALCQVKRSSMEASTNGASHVFPRDAIHDQYDVCIDSPLGNCTQPCWWAKLWGWFWNQLEVVTSLMPQYQTPERGAQTFLSPVGSKDRNTTIGKTERWAGEERPECAATQAGVGDF